MHAEEVNCGDENVHEIFETTETTLEWIKHETSNRMLVEDRQGFILDHSLKCIDSC